MVFGGALPFVAEGIGFGAPNAEAGAFVKALGVWRRGADAEANNGDARQQVRVLDGGVQQARANPLPAVTGENVHAPEMDFVCGFDVAVAVKAERPYQIWGERADDDGIGRTIF